LARLGVDRAPARLYVFGFQHPGTFNGLVFAWMAYPHFGYVEQTQFGDVVQFREFFNI
jgi:hypothetical protein